MGLMTKNYETATVSGIVILNMLADGKLKEGDSFSPIHTLPSNDIVFTNSGLYYYDGNVVNWDKKHLLAFWEMTRYKQRRKVIKEVTIDEIAEKFGVDVDQIKIKK